MSYTQSTQNQTRLASAVELFRRHHLRTAEEVSQEFFHDLVDRTVKAGELDAELGVDTSNETMPIMPEDEFQEILRGTLTARRVAKQRLASDPRHIAYITSSKADEKTFTVEDHLRAYPGAMISQQMVDAEITWTAAPVQSHPMTEFSVGKVRVIDHTDVKYEPINEFHQQVLETSERPVLGGCIPSVRWGDVDSILTYLHIFKEIAAPAEDERLGKPAYTADEIERRVDGELNSKCFMQIAAKLRRRLLVDGVLDTDFARRLNAEGFHVSYVQTLGKLNVEITPDHKLSWEV